MIGPTTILGNTALTVGGVLALLLLIVPVFWLIATYNGLRRAQVRAQNAFSQIDVQLKRRFDLIPNLVETVKGYMAHERGTLEAVIAARAKASSALGAVEGGEMGVVGMGALASATGTLDGALGRLFGLVERYPELKANQNALQLQEELASTENRIAFARQAYNDAVMRLNEGIVVFPASIVANLFSIREMGMFEAAAGEREAVAVKF
ncbi:MAG: LemA family protein [Phycisphaerales bacterium]|jgi:LemA protein